MKIEEHDKAYEEHIKNINRIIEEGVEENQRNIGYNVSQASIELFSIFLHKLNLIQSSGEQFDHRTFKSNELIEKKIPPEFAEKERIIKLMREIELDRNVICYGKRKPKDKIEKMIKCFNELRTIINSQLKEQNDKQK
ncbi:MAG: hypothetical protein AABW67_00745 [Nanoarchaeota archaeon]